MELEAVFLKPGVLLTTYGMVQHNNELFCSSPVDPLQNNEGTGSQDSFLWDFMILDEVESLHIDDQRITGCHHFETCCAAVICHAVICLQEASHEICRPFCVA